MTSRGRTRCPRGVRAVAFFRCGTLHASLSFTAFDVFVSLPSVSASLRFRVEVSPRHQSSCRPRRRAQPLWPRGRGPDQVGRDRRSAQPHVARRNCVLRKGDWVHGATGVQTGRQRSTSKKSTNGATTWPQDTSPGRRGAGAALRSEFRGRDSAGHARRQPASTDPQGKPPPIPSVSRGGPVLIRWGGGALSCHPRLVLPHRRDTDPTRPLRHDQWPRKHRCIHVGWPSSRRRATRAAATGCPHQQCRRPAALRTVRRRQRVAAGPGGRRPADGRCAPAGAYVRV